MDAASRADLSIVLVALIGGNHPIVSPVEFQAHLSSKFHVSEGAAKACAWLESLSACKRLQDGHSSSSCERAGLEDGTDLMLWSRPRQLPTAVDTTMDPMLVEVAIQGRPPTAAPLWN